MRIRKILSTFLKQNRGIVGIEAAKASNLRINASEEREAVLGRIQISNFSQSM